MEQSKRYSYGILKENHQELSQERALLYNDYRSTKYALIEKQCFADGSEGINRIIYSDSIGLMISQLVSYVSWYNYITGESKSIHGYITEIP